MKESYKFLNARLKVSNSILNPDFIKRLCEIMEEYKKWNIKSKKRKKKYVAGNWLRGFYEGEFSSIEEAWSYLSKRFLLSYPSTGGRSIYMYVEEMNQFNFKQLLTCKEGVTELNELPEEQVMEKCKLSNNRFL